tara:strand:+ start:462 stop:818 length:357 start_codon:yes stop_codon:yes gene_type:complete
MNRHLNIFIILIIISLNLSFKKKLGAELLHLNCKVVDKPNSFYAISNFYRIIDLKKKKIIYQSGMTFDKITHFNETEIIMLNYIYENYSVFNLNSKTWTIFKKRKILNYICNKKKAPN